MTNIFHTLWENRLHIQSRIVDLFSNKKIKLAIQFVWVGSIAFFLFLYIKQNWLEFRDYQWVVTINWLIIALLIAITRRFIGGLRWVFISLDNKKNWSVKEGILHLRAYFLSNMAMYIPGSIWFMIGRIQYEKEIGVSVKRTSFGLIYEQILLVLSGMTFGIYAAFYIFTEYRHILILISIIVAISWFCFLSPKCINFGLKIISSFTKYKIQTIDITYRWGIIQLLLATLLWFSGGLSQFYIIKAFYPELLSQFLGYTISISALSWTIGFLAPWAPSGLGVREGLLVWLFVRYLPVQVCLAATVTSRLVTVFEDIVWLIISLLFLRTKNEKSKI